MTSDRTLEAGTHSLHPWRVVTESGERVIRGQPPGYGPKVAVVMHRVFEHGKPAATDPEADANARLVAAAPELLAAADAILELGAKHAELARSEAFARLQAAAASARGAPA